MKNNNIYFIGLGAIGTLFASQFVDNNYKVNILVDQKRYDKYNKNNFIINGKLYCFNYVKKEEVNEHIDILFISTKHHHIKEIISLLDGIIDKETLIVSLINGIDSEEELKKYLPNAQIYHGYVVGTDATKVDNKTEFVLKGNIIFGDVYNNNESALKNIEEVLKVNHIGYKKSDDIIKDLWWKLMVNVGLNQVTALYNSNYGQLNASEIQKDLVDKAMTEVVLVAQAEGIELYESDKEKVIKLMKSFNSDGKTSMLQDINANRKTEVEIFASKIISLGKKHNIPTPTNEYLEKKIIELENKYLNK